MTFKRLLLPMCLGIAITVPCLHASAQVLNYQVFINTGALNPANTYYAEFDLSNGSVASLGVPDTANNVTLSNFMFGGGSAGAVLPPNIGDASGDMTSTITLADGDPGGVADLAQAFTPGSGMTFDVAMTTNVDAASSIPDSFVIWLLDPTVNQIPTNAPGDIPNAFVRVDLDSTSLVLGNVQAYGNDIIPIPAPTISPIPENGSTPEPGSLALLLSGSVLGSLVALRHRRRRSAR